MLRFFFILFFILLTSFNKVEPLKAILIVGQQEDGTIDAIKEMDDISKFLESKGVICYKFYDDKAIWNNIIKISSDCNFLLYMGHGTTLGKNNSYGGFCIHERVSSQMISQQLKLKPNSLILMQSVCGASGTSASDKKDIGIIEAKKRVLSFSEPFFDCGALGYYSSNYKQSSKKFLQEFFEGKSLEEIYNKSASLFTQIEFDSPHIKTNMRYSIASRKPKEKEWTIYIWENGVKRAEKIPSSKTYEIAYVGIPSFTINDMKK